MPKNCIPCGRRADGYVVTRPGQQPREVASEKAAQSLVQGIPGATYKPKSGGSK